MIDERDIAFAVMKNGSVVLGKSNSRSGINAQNGTWSSDVETQFINGYVTRSLEEFDNGDVIVYVRDIRNKKAWWNFWGPDVERIEYSLKYNDSERRRMR